MTFPAQAAAFFSPSFGGGAPQQTLVSVPQIAAPASKVISAWPFCYWVYRVVCIKFFEDAVARASTAAVKGDSRGMLFRCDIEPPRRLMRRRWVTESEGFLQS